jgi:hypothetical protein
MFVLIMTIQAICSYILSLPEKDIKKILCEFYNVRYPNPLNSENNYYDAVVTKRMNRHGNEMTVLTKFTLRYRKLASAELREMHGRWINLIEEPMYIEVLNGIIRKYKIQSFLKHDN